MQPILILGAGAYAPELADLIEATEDLRVAGFIVNERQQQASSFLGLPVHWIDDIGPLAKSHLGLCSLATPARDGFVQQARAKGLSFATLFHPTASVSARSSLDDGTIVATCAIVAAYTKIGQHVRINRGAMVGHHTQVGDFVTIQPGANIAGCCRIGDGATIAMGAVVIDRVTIGEDAVVGAGAVVTKDVPPGAQVVGVPARVVKYVGMRRTAA